MKKMLVSDYDQTFYLNDEDIEVNKKSVEKFMKVENIFVIATGRSYFDFNNKKEMYNLKYDYVILNHGATIIDRNDKILLNMSMPNDIIVELKKELQIEKSINWFCCSGIESRVDFEYPDLTKIHVKYENKDKAIEISKIINRNYGKYVNAYYVSHNSVEIISKQTNKALAIYEIINLEKINKENVCSIGDSYSDIDMVKEFNGYCVENSVDELKNVAKGQVNSVSLLIDKILFN